MAYYINDGGEYQGYEVCNIENGLGEIILYGGDSESALCFLNKPIAFVWPDCAGSIAEYLSRTASYNDYAETLEKIRQIVDGSIEYENVPLSETLAGLLILFESGQYLIGEYEIDDYELFDVKKTISSPMHYYPLGWPFILTKPTGELDESTIQEHMQKIKNGKRPKVIVASVYYNGTLYVIDGHHKLEAYKRLNIYPWVIEIVSVLSKPLNVELGCSMLNNNSKVIYEKIKKEYLNYIIQEKPIDLDSESILVQREKLKTCIGKKGL